MSTSSNTPVEITDDVGIARVLNLSTSFVRKDRLGKRSIPFFRVGTSIRYSVPHVLAALIAKTEGGPPAAMRAPRKGRAS